ncbi:MAG: Fe-S-containing protein [Methanolobus sp.]|nr:Fe-S-containing protein [Methanolobus sp.]
MTFKIIAVVLSVLVISVLALGCTGNDPAALKDSAKPVEATWINPLSTDQTVSIPVEAVNMHTNVHFKVNTDIGELVLMAYMFDDDIFIRSNVCPPCGSIGFALDDSILICDACASTFDASTGKGIGGACVAYPKESVPYTVSGGTIIMNLEDVMSAHQESLRRK